MRLRIIKKRYYSFFYLLLGLGFIASCSDGNTGTGNKPYFDIEGYFNSEIIRLGKESAFFVKSLDSDGKTDEIKNKYPDWKLELQLFYEADINKAASIGKMQVDTLKDVTDSTHQAFTIVYTPRDKNIKVKELRVSFNRFHQVKEIYAHLESGSFIDSISNNLHYLPGKLYEISTNEHTILTGDSYYKVKGNILIEDTYFQ